MALNINGTTGISGVDGSNSSPAIQGTDSNTGVSFGADTVNINTGGVTRATLTSAGRLGVGVTSPTHKFQVSDGTTAIGFSRSANNPEIIFDSNNVTSASVIKSSESSGGAYLEFFTKQTSGTLSNRMSIDPNGIMNLRGYLSNFGDQTQHHCIQNNRSTSWAAQFVNTASLGYGMEIRVNSATASREGIYLYSTADSQSKAAILTNGTFNSRTNTYGSLSDVKLKENIVDANSQWNDLKAIKVRNFNFISDSSNTKLLGVVAQELETVCPSLVEEVTDKEIDENGDRVETGTTTKSVKYSVLYMKAIKALQEAQTRIETLETKVAALEAG